MWTLTLCIGMFMAICGQVREVTFPDRESCERERAAQVRYVGDGYAVCAPGQLRTPKGGA
jgi:hypothetical protein